MTAPADQTEVNVLPAREWLRVSEIAAWLGCSKPPLYAAVTSGELPSVKIGRRLRIQRADLFAYLKRPDPLVARAA